MEYPELHERKVDLILARWGNDPVDEEPDAGLDVEVLFNDPYFLVVEARRVGTAPPNVDLADLVDEPLVMPPVDAWGGALVADCVQKAWVESAEGCHIDALNPSSERAGRKRSIRNITAGLRGTDLRQAIFAQGSRYRAARPSVPGRDRYAEKSDPWPRREAVHPKCPRSLQVDCWPARLNSWRKSEVAGTAPGVYPKLYQLPRLLLVMPAARQCRPRVMLFNSPEFILGFLPAALAGFFLLGRIAGRDWAMRWLLVTGLFFYGWWNARFVALLAGSIIANYCCGQRVLHLARAGDRRAARRWLIAGISLDLALLGWFEYAGLRHPHQSAAATGYSTAGTGHRRCPSASRFFTFPQIAYLVDELPATTRGRDSCTTPLRHLLPAPDRRADRAPRAR